MFSSGSSNAINIITGIAAAGVIIGAMSLFIVLSGFAGLKDFSLQFSTFFDPDLTLFPGKGKSIELTAEKKEALVAMEDIAVFSEVVEERVYLEYDNKRKMAYIKGVGANYDQIIETDKILIEGEWLTGNDYQVVVGERIRAELGMWTGNAYAKLLSMYVPKPGKGISRDLSKSFRKETGVHIGTYSVNEELNKKYVFSTVGLARKLLGLEEEEVTNIEIKLVPDADEAVVIKKLKGIFGDQIEIKNRTQLNDTLYKMLNTENLVSYLVITLIAVIALFNVAGAIIMMIIDKKGNIKTLFNMGATLGDIRNIFLMQGALMTVLGTLLGLFLGFVLIVLQQQFGFLMITPTMQYPTRITGMSFLIVFFTITIIGTIAALLASSRINPKLVA